jgi:glycolate oxidase
MPTETDILQKLQFITGEPYSHKGREAGQRYGKDETEDYYFEPQWVCLPSNTDEVCAIMQLAYKLRIPVTTRGGGTGLAGGALPVQGGIVLSMERMNRILHIDEENLQVTVEPGVITEILQDTLKAKGLYYPPDPSSRGISFIGGNVSTNAGGPRAVKYGVVRDYVLNLEVVLADGTVIQTGANTLKNSTGYNLTQLMVGSEGTLGVVTKIVLKLLPHPIYQLLLLVPFQDPVKACAAVSAIFRSGVIPSAIEFMERDAIEWSARYLGKDALSADDPTQAHLLIEVDGFYEEPLYKDVEKIAAVVQEYEAGEILFADDEATKKELWALRRHVGHAVKTNSIYKEEDTVVPRARLPELLSHVKALGREYGFRSVCYGHAGDGNLHVNILKDTLDDHTWEVVLPQAIRRLFSYVKELGGTLSGEHGVGYVQKEYLDTVFSTSEIALRHQIKKVFDPSGILNPGKLFPQSFERKD